MKDPYEMTSDEYREWTLKEKRKPFIRWLKGESLTIDEMVSDVMDYVPEEMRAEFFEELSFLREQLVKERVIHNG